MWVLTSFQSRDQRLISELNISETKVERKLQNRDARDAQTQQKTPACTGNMQLILPRPETPPPNWRKTHLDLLARSQKSSDVFTFSRCSILDDFHPLRAQNIVSATSYSEYFVRRSFVTVSRDLFVAVCREASGWINFQTSWFPPSSDPAWEWWSPFSD